MQVDDQKVRNHRLGVRLHRGEREAVERAAAASGRTVSEFVRAAVLEAVGEREGASDPGPEAS